MSKTVSFHNPDFPDGTVFDVGGLAIPNGGSVTLDHDQELSFFSKNQMNVADVFKGDKLVKVTGDSELSKTERDDHTAKHVDTTPAENLDELVIDVDPPVDSEGNVVEEEVIT